MLTEELIAKLKEANPGAELSVIEEGEIGLEVVVKVPDEGAWRRFRAQQDDDAQSSIALRGLVFACVVHPVPADFVPIVARRPGIVETVGGKLVKIAGVSRAATIRKL